MQDQLALFQGASSSMPAPQRDRTKLTPIDPVALAALRAGTISHAGSRVTLDLPQMVPDVYAKLTPILQLCGFEWKSRIKSHVAPAGSEVVLRSVIDAGVYDDTKRGLEFFATSESAAKMMAELIQRELWQDNPRILEPSAGEGVLVKALLEAIPHASVTAVEINPARAARLRTVFAGDERVEIVENDILSIADRTWDGVIMNPPFAEALEHLEHIYQMLEPGAYVVGIASLNRPRDRELAQWLNDRDAWEDETDSDTFVDTMIRASYFGFRAGGRSYVEQLVDSLIPHPSIGMPQVRQLMDYSRDIHQLDEDFCNGAIQEFLYDARIQKLLESAAAILRPEGIGIRLAYDPRSGHGFRLTLPSERNNDWGRSGMIVPPSWRAVSA